MSQYVALLRGINVGGKNLRERSAERQVRFTNANLTNANMAGLLVTTGNLAAAVSFDGATTTGANLGFETVIQRACF